jgi:hypothetical protein
MTLHIASAYLWWKQHSKTDVANDESLATLNEGKLIPKKERNISAVENGLAKNINDKSAYLVWQFDHLPPYHTGFFFYSPFLIKYK